MPEKESRLINLTTGAYALLEAIALEAGIVADRGHSAGKGSVTGLIQAWADACQNEQEKSILTAIAKNIAKRIDKSD